MCIAIDLCEKINSKIITAQCEFNRLRNELSTADKTISDILHELEFSDSLSASKGYMYAKLLKDIRNSRRIIKDELEGLQLFLQKFNESQILELQKKLKNLEGKQRIRTYTPRVLSIEKKQMLKII